MQSTFKMQTELPFEKQMNHGVKWELHMISAHQLLLA